MIKPRKPPRPKSRETEHEDVRLPHEPGQPPRHATVPPGKEWSTRTPKTATHPVTGEPQPEHPLHKD